MGVDKATRIQLGLFDDVAWEERRSLEPVAPSPQQPVESDPKDTQKPRPTDAELEAAMLAKAWARHRDSGDRGRVVRIARTQKYGVSVGGLYEPWSELWELEELEEA